MKNDFFKIKIILSAVLMIFMPAVVIAGGVSPYLPLNKSPEIERQIERVLILAGKPVMTRPIAVATVLEALDKAREKDEELCEQVESYLMRYMQNFGMTQLGAEVSVSTGDSDQVIPNQHGKDMQSSWEVSGEFHYRLGTYGLINLGGIAYDGNATPTGSMLSVGIDYAQLDIGYRDHWLSPFTDSSMLISTEAPTMPSITLSNYKPISRLGLSYQVYLAEMSESSRIAYQDRYTTGKPRLAGVHLRVEPVDGYAFSINRQFQYSGGERDQDSFSDFVNALVNPSRYDNVNPSLSFDEQFGNQQASLTSRILFPGKRTFSVYFEYAGEDSSRMNTNWLGDVSFSMGIDIPILWNRFDLTYETTEWQNCWYVHGLYRDGMTNYGRIIGHWFGDQRQFNDDAGGMSHMLRLGWQLDDGTYLQGIYRTLKNDSYTVIAYKRMQELALSYFRPWRGQTIGMELYSGRDVHGDWYTRLSASMNFNQNWWTVLSDNTSQNSSQDDVTDLFVDIGMNYCKFHTNLLDKQDRNRQFRDAKYSNGHLGFGAVRNVSEHNDFGVRIEWDRIAEYSILSFRMLDYRYHIGAHFALSGFFGVGCYDLDTSAYGYYFGGGVQFVNILPKWDLCIDARRHLYMARTKVVASDSSHGTLRYNLRGVTVYLSRRF